MGKYLFRDTDQAALRLERLADAYAPYSRRFVRQHVDSPPDVVFDLGCGPGRTTRLLAEATGSPQVVGLDRSSSFITRARRNAPHGVSFVQHDITIFPFPVEAADLAYCRLVLAHQTDPLKLLGRWTEVLRPGGQLLVEELEWVDCKRRIFNDYLEIVVAMLADEGYDMYAGPHLTQVADEVGSLVEASSEVGEVPLATHAVAELFFLNIQTWKQQPFIQANYDSESLQEMEIELRSLTKPTHGDIGLTWGVRRLTAKRRPD